MQQTQLGKTGWPVGEVGLGCWQFGGDFGPMAEQTAMQIMVAAVERGTTFFDTADVYGGGRSETLIGLRQEGKIRHFGASVESVEEAMVCLEHDDLASLQIIGMDSVSTWARPSRVCPSPGASSWPTRSSRLCPRA